MSRHHSMLMINGSSSSQSSNRAATCKAPDLHKSNLLLSGIAKGELATCNGSLPFGGRTVSVFGIFLISASFMPLGGVAVWASHLVEFVENLHGRYFHKLHLARSIGPSAHNPLIAQITALGDIYLNLRQ
eukprot:6051601-Ditylum_brightwellii.AAC.1